MENLPPLPTGFDNMMEITNTVEVEVESKGQKFLFMFIMNIDVTFDPEANEIVIECQEERIDSVH
ncbi:hypothetical protein HQ533_04210 [Candidatus Woesearchaeota archaeon]|nr:hypothetical protein [Candidatus Woesearchaeota archaeon]